MNDLTPALVEFETPDHLVLPGLLFEPKVPTDQVVIVLHGNGSSSILGQQQSLRQFVTKLNDRNIAYFAFNNRGASYISKIRVIEDGVEKRQKYGMSYELIKECVQDIDGAIAFLEERGYKNISLLGFSTGANKICIYNYYKPTNSVSTYILACGGDDVGIYYNAWGKEKFDRLLDESKTEMKDGRGRDLVASLITEGIVISYQSLFDTINPDGDYNVFPYYETLNKDRLGTKDLFREFASIKKPTLVVYGENDEHCRGQVPEIMSILKETASNSSDFEFDIIPKADHGFTGKKEELADSVVNFLATQ